MTGERPRDRMVRVWIPLPVAIALGVVALGAAAVLAGQTVAGQAVALAFFLLVPGLAIVRLIGLRDVLLEAILSVALSLALAGLVASSQAYLGAWSPNVTLAILVAITAGALVIRPVLATVPRWLPRLTTWIGAVGSLARPIGRLAGGAAEVTAGLAQTAGERWAVPPDSAMRIRARLQSIGTSARGTTMVASQSTPGAEPVERPAAEGVAAASTISPVRSTSVRRAAAPILRKVAIERPARAAAVPAGAVPAAAVPARKKPGAEKLAPASAAAMPHRRKATAEKEVPAPSAPRRKEAPVASDVPSPSAPRRKKAPVAKQAPVASEVPAPSAPRRKKEPVASEVPVASEAPLTKAAGASNRRKAAPEGEGPATAPPSRGKAPGKTRTPAVTAARTEKRAAPATVPSREKAQAQSRVLAARKAPAPPAGKGGPPTSGSRPAGSRGPAERPLPAAAKPARKKATTVSPPPAAAQTPAAAPTPAAATPPRKKASADGPAPASKAAPPARKKATTVSPAATAAESPAPLAESPAPPAATTRPDPKARRNRGAMSAVAAITDATLSAARLVRAPDGAIRRRPSGKEASDELPPPPVAVIRRRPTADEPGSEPRSARRGPLRDDGLTGSAANRAVRSAIEQVVEDLAEQRDRTRK